MFSLENGDDVGNASWKKFGQNIYREANGDEFGHSVSLSVDAKTLAVGAPSINVNGEGTGHVRVYQMHDLKLSWMQLGEDINGEDAYDFLEFLCLCRQMVVRWQSHLLMGMMMTLVK